MARKPFITSPSQQTYSNMKPPRYPRAWVLNLPYWMAHRPVWMILNSWGEPQMLQAVS
jgi:hypothetical protein